MEQLQKELRKKRTEYVLGLINQYKESGEVQGLFNCYDYVKIMNEFSLIDFKAQLKTDEKALLEKREDIWFSCFESLNTFKIFLDNNEISFKE